MGQSGTNRPEPAGPGRNESRGSKIKWDIWDKWNTRNAQKEPKGEEEDQSERFGTAKCPHQSELPRSEKSKGEFSSTEPNQ
ncbi:hypothetical protein KI387_020617 [Taxus chinensis]|uniref:Uncharacterized protein n=1 Tax=Taxus chinensis TaxID=29808 RepID=A0AA38GBV2_TAXCH|nr:hypothetical protein KI387_020617 [Taxus chinensis]